LPLGADISIPGLDLVVSGKRLIGSMMGDNRFRVDMPRFVDLYLDGRLKLDEMISARMPLERVNDAFDALRKATAARTVLTFD
jgi:S-(hydroxymethyl)glutathione dehydrogenase/alcohol dehydrogenase